MLLLKYSVSLRSHLFIDLLVLFVTILYLFFKGFLFLFIWQRERQPAREGTQAGGVGEEEAGSQRRSLMWGLIPGPQDHALSWRQALNDWATQVPLYLSLKHRFSTHHLKFPDCFIKTFIFNHPNVTKHYLKSPIVFHTCEHIYIFVLKDTWKQRLRYLILLIWRNDNMKREVNGG